MNNKRSAPNLKGEAAPLALQEAVKKLIAEQGEAAVAEKLGVSKQTLARLASGFTVLRSTVAVVEMRMGIS